MRQRASFFATALVVSYLVVLPSLAGFAGYPTAASAGRPADRLVINEIDYDQPGTDAAEFIEIWNNSGSSTTCMHTVSTCSTEPHSNDQT